MLHVSKLRNDPIPGIPHKGKLVIVTENIRTNFFTNLPSQKVLQATSLIFVFKPAHKTHPKIVLSTALLFWPNHILNRRSPTLGDVDENTFFIVRNHNSIEESAHSRCQGSPAGHRGSQRFLKRSHAVIPFEE